MTKEELITYIKNNDKYFSLKQIENYHFEVLTLIQKTIETQLKSLPKGFRIYSSGYNKEIEEFLKTILTNSKI